MKVIRRMLSSVSNDGEWRSDVGLGEQGMNLVLAV